MAAGTFMVTVLVVGFAFASLLLSRGRTYQTATGLVCPNDASVDFSKLVGPAAHWKPSDARDEADEAALLSVQRTLARRPSGDAPAIEVWVLGALPPGRTRITAARSSGGLWTVHVEREGPRPLGEEARSTSTLSKAQGHELEAVLGNPCLYAEPSLIGNEYPSASERSGHCFDGANTFVDIDFERRRRTAVQACATYGLTGKLVALIREPPGQGRAGP